VQATISGQKVQCRQRNPPPAPMTATWGASECLPEPSIAEFELPKPALHALTLILVGQPKAKPEDGHHGTAGRDQMRRRRRRRRAACSMALDLYLHTAITRTTQPRLCHSLSPLHCSPMDRTSICKTFRFREQNTIRCELHDSTSKVSLECST
jgi:hypothetical protein